MKRILLVRTDRIGDVVLTTPAIKALRDKYPDSYIGFLTREFTKDIIEGNPWLDDVFIFEKHANGWRDFLSTLRIANLIRKKNFEVALILNPNLRANIIAFLAGIPRRIGFARKGAYLLTQSFEDKKWQGSRHESEYTLEMLKAIGVHSAQKALYVPIKKESQEYVDNFLKENAVDIEANGRSPLLVGVQCGASCQSKIWPAERFAQVADKLIDELGCKVFVFCAPNESHIRGKVISLMKNKPLIIPNFTLSLVAALLARARLLISNDSGPVHIAVAVGTPVISIFGRNLAGLSPSRWKPLGPKDVFLRKDVGCEVCLAHNCKLDFKCLKAITADEVYNTAESILKGGT